MPKQPTFKRIYPKLRNPFNSGQNSESHATLRERTNILRPVSTSISLLPPITPITNNNRNPMGSNQKITPKYIASSSITTNHGQYALNDQENFFLGTSEAASQYDINN